MDEREDTVGRLLEGTTNFSRAERDEMFDDVFASVSAEESAEAKEARPGWLRWFALAAVVCLAVVPASFLLTPGEPTFTARGADGNVQLRCSGAPACSLGDTLTFELSAPPQPWFAAFARSDAGTVVWYFPETPDAESIRVDEGLLERSVTLGDEHAPGTWTVHAIFTDTPLDREQIRDSFTESGEFSRPDAKLIRRQIDIR